MLLLFDSTTIFALSSVTMLWLGSSTKYPKLAALAALLAVPAQGAVSYSEGHFERVQKVTDLEGLSAFVEEHISQGKTVFTRFISSEG